MRRLANLTRCAVLGAALAVLSGYAPAQGAYPNRPIRLIVGVPAGQSTDIIARLLASKVGAILGQSFVVDNRPGAGGIISQEAAKSALADGYTLVMASGATMAINPALYRKLPYDPVADFEPIVGLISAPLFLFTSPSTPVTSTRYLVNYVKSSSAPVAYGSTGNGGTQHIAMEMLKKQAGIDMIHVPYKGAPPMVTDVIGGQVMFGFDAAPSILPMAAAGQVKLLGISSARRSPVAPDVPTIAEQGLSGYSAETWAALFAPKRTPGPIVDKLNATFNEVLKDPAVKAELIRRGAQATGGTPAELKHFVAAELVRWRDAVRASGARVD